MKDEAFEEEDVRRRIQVLSDAGRLAFSWGCCVRLLPAYERFRFASNGWGSQTPLMVALDSIWDCVAGGALPKSQIDRLTGACERAAPPSDHFSSHYSTLAQDAVNAVCSVLDYLGNGDLERLVNASRYPVDVIDMHVQESEGIDPQLPELEEWTLNHPLMRQEIRRRERDLTELLELDLGRVSDRAQFAERAKKEDVLILAADHDS